jgi:peptide deformylase
VLFIDRLDAAQRKLAMKEIRAAQWWGEPLREVKVSPHPTYGKAL